MPDELASITYSVAEHDCPATERVWSATNTPLLDHQGAVEFILQHTVDVTETRRLQSDADATRVQAQLLSRARSVQEANRALDLERRYLLRLFDQAPVFVASMLGPTHIFEIANAAYMQLVGHRAVIGKPIREALPDIEGQGFYELLDGVFTTGNAFVGRGLKVDIQRHQGAEPEQRFVDLVYQPIRNVDGTVTGILATGTDVSELKHATLERDRLIAVLQASNASLDRFVYVASHDLKSPLRGIATTAHFISEELGPTPKPSLREYLELLQTRVARMDALIDGILSYARAGQNEATMTVDVGLLIRESFELLGPSPKVTFAVGVDMPTLVTAPVPLQQVFMNLFSNALKHSLRDDVSISVTCQREGEWYRFAVGDNGPGIAPEFHEKVWEMFQTLRARDVVEGSGIGLSTVKKIVESRGGRVAIESTPGQGARFVFWWPAHEPLARALPTA